ncbi:DUF1489 family protein [Parvularcula sp. IMCC14364]|uniref:DUF1489 family protein n=1 Tax=Parvularcula sp. IMCC14364 TaxID=3067902 RepID=UPI0027403CFD|nr:DUF1489 domain-containing protein [Parvularcula sp. IMCC14364]
MTESKLNLIKLCVGAENVDDLIDWRQRSLALRKKAGLSAHTFHTTRMWPRREAELLDGGSLYWVIKGLVSVRQPIHGFEETIGSDDIKRCNILLEPEFIMTEPWPKRPFQGWRYLKKGDAPPDIRAGSGLAPELATELAELGLL